MVPEKKLGNNPRVKKETLAATICIFEQKNK